MPTSSAVTARARGRVGRKAMSASFVRKRNMSPLMGREGFLRLGIDAAIVEARKVRVDRGFELVVQHREGLRDLDLEKRRARDERQELLDLRLRLELRG